MGKANMASYKNVVHLNIFMVKKQFSKPEEVISEDKCQGSLDVLIAGYDRGKLYFRSQDGIVPKWAQLFANAIGVSRIGTNSYVSAVFQLSVAGRIFLLTFGQGGRFLIKDDVCEERFGLIVALNSVAKNSLRCIDKQSLDTIQSHSRIQSSKETTPDQFGLDVEQDILRAIVGAPRDPNLGSRITGTDSLSVSVRMGLDDLPELLKLCKEQFEKELSDADFQWVNNISEVKNAYSLISELDAKLVAKFINGEFSDLWLSIPGIIQWDLVKGFSYTNCKRVIYPDINLTSFLETLDDEKSISLEILKSRRVWCADADHNQIFKSWNIYKCIYAEIDHDGQKYILNNGKWFYIKTDFVSKTNREFGSISLSKLNLPEYKGETEETYNKNIAEQFPSKFALMDKKKIFHGGGSGQVEFCDLFSSDKELIHVKKYGQSTVFSHLFSQGFVSGQLLQLDDQFRKKVVEKLHDPFKKLINISSRPGDKEFTIVFGIISDSKGKKINLPFFSRVNLNNAARMLKGFGYKVELLKINVDQMYAKTTLCPPR